MLNTFKNSQDLYKNRPWLTFLVLVTLGTMVLAVCSLLLGCGSDSTPGGAVKGKNAKASSSPATKDPQASTVLLMEGKGVSVAGKTDIKKQPERNSVLMHGITMEEMEARNAAAVKMARSASMEIKPAVTREEMEARNAAAVKMAQSPGMEVMPGVTLEQMKAKNAAAVKMARSPGMEVMPGVTLEQMEKKRNAAAANAPKKPPIRGN
jgi:hypothetical protein